MTVVSRELLRLDPAPTCRQLEGWIRDAILASLGRRGAVVALSGGVDSSVVAALCARALGPEHVLGLLMPERESPAGATELGLTAARHAGIAAVTEDITDLLEAAGAYRRRDDAIRTAIPEFGRDWRAKPVLPSLRREGYRRAAIVAESPDGRRVEAPLKADAYRIVVAATSFKQRLRKTLEYFHADENEFAVVGTPNLLEFDQGFFVKNGDGAADLKPIAHLYKSQVYQLAEYLEIPEEIRRRAPSTDTYSLDQDQEEFFFSLPYESFDLCLYAVDRGLSPQEVAGAIGVAPAEAERVFDEIRRRRRLAAYLHKAPLVPAR